MAGFAATGPTSRNGQLMADPRDKPEDDGPESRSSTRNLSAAMRTKAHNPGNDGLPSAINQFRAAPET
jgi:hypothetical protein